MKGTAMPALQHLIFLSSYLYCTSAVSLPAAYSQLKWSAPLPVPVNSSSSNRIPDDFAMYVSGSTFPLTPISCYMNTLNALARLSPLPFDGVEKAQTFSYPMYEDVSIELQLDGETIERRYLIWGLTQAINWLSTTVPEHQFRFVYFTLLWKESPVGRLVVAPNPMPPLPAIEGIDINRTAQSLQNRAETSHSLDQTSSEGIPQIYNSSSDTSIMPVAAARTSFAPIFKTKELSAAAFFVIIAFGMCQFAEFDAQQDDLPFIQSDPKLHVSIGATKMDPPTPSPREFTNGWVIFAWFRTAEAGVEYYKVHNRLVEMSGVLAFAPSRGPFVNAGLVAIHAED